MGNMARRLARFLFAWSVVCGVIEPHGAFATVQGPLTYDRIVIGEHIYVILQHPMLGLWSYDTEKPLPEGKKWAPEFDSSGTADWAGYRATWEIRGSKLFLQSIRGKIKGKSVKNRDIIPGGDFPLSASWYSGKIFVPIGDYDANSEMDESVIEYEVEKGDVKSARFHITAKPNWSWNGID